MGDITWDEGDTPVSTRFGDPYYSRHDGQAETRHVFLAGNDLPGRWQGRDDFTIAELGFGTGLNFLETLANLEVCRDGPERLAYVAFERYPIERSDLARALARWEGLSQNAEQLLAAWPPSAGWSETVIGRARLTLAIGDANELLPEWRGRADAWYLDGFSPAKNADLWEADLMRTVAAHTMPGGTFATFTAAGWVRRNLAAAGFAVVKMPGYGRKRECLRGVLPTSEDSTEGRIS